MQTPPPATPQGAPTGSLLCQAREPPWEWGKGGPHLSAAVQGEIMRRETRASSESNSKSHLLPRTPAPQPCPVCSIQTLVSQSHTAVFSS